MSGVQKTSKGTRAYLLRSLSYQETISKQRKTKKDEKQWYSKKRTSELRLMLYMRKQA